MLKNQMNKILALRTEIGLSRRALAKKVGVSAQHIQRLETGKQARIGILLAKEIGVALGQPIEVVFPATRAALKRVTTSEDLFRDATVRQDMEKAGVDMEVLPWFLQMRLRGRQDVIDVLPADGERERLWSCLQDRRQAPAFVVFEGADGYRYAVQQQHLLAWHFGFDPHRAPAATAEDDARLWLSDGTPPMTIGANMDEPWAHDRDGRLQSIFESLSREHGTDHVLSLTDDGGEALFFRVEDVALFRAAEHLIGFEGGGDEIDDEEE